MTPTNPGAGVHLSRASAVVVQRVPAAEVEWFLGWQAEVDRAEVSRGRGGLELTLNVGPELDAPDGRRLRLGAPF